MEPPTAQKPHPPFWVGAGSRGSISKVAERGYNLLLDQFAPFAATGERLAWFKQEVEARGRVFDPMEVGVARAFYVAKDAADKQAALERRLAAQQRQHALAQTPGGDNKASIMSFADTTGANEDSALYGTPGRDLPEDRGAGEAGRAVPAADRRRGGAGQPAPLRARGDAGILGRRERGG